MTEPPPRLERRSTPPDAAPPGADRPGVRELVARLAIDLTPLRTSQSFRRIWLAQTASFVGTEIAYVALVYQVYALTKSSLAVGLLSLVELVPLLTLTLLGGAFADALDRRRLILWQQIGMSLGSAALLANAALPHPKVWACYAGGFVAASSFSFGVGAQRSLTPRLVSAEQVSAGPIAAVWLLPPIAASVDAAGPTIRSIVDGFRYVRRQPVVLGFFLVDTNAMIFGMPSALFPALAYHRFGDPTLVGSLYAATYGGALVASLLGGWVRHVRRQGLAVVVAAASWGVAITAFGFARALWLALLLLALAGAADLISAVFRSTILLTLVPDELRGRLSGIEFAQVASTPSLGNLEAGVVASLTSLRFSIVSGGLLCVV